MTGRPRCTSASAEMKPEGITVPLIATELSKDESFNVERYTQPKAVLLLLLCLTDTPTYVTLYSKQLFFQSYLFLYIHVYLARVDIYLTGPGWVSTDC